MNNTMNRTTIFLRFPAIILMVMLLGFPLKVARSTTEGLAAPADPISPLDPPTLFNPYGTVKVNGENVPDGTLVGGWCAGILADEVPSEILDFGGSLQSLYALEIPDTVCAAGSPITFTINRLAADQSTTWVNAPQRVDLTSIFAVALTQQVSADGSTWLDADSAVSPLVAQAGTPLQWRFAVTNTSAVTVGLMMTSTVDGVTPRDLGALCSPPLPAELTPVGEVGDSAACQFTGSAPTGIASNLLFATIQDGMWTYHASDPAYSFGYQLALDVQKSVFDGSTWFTADVPATYPDLTIDEELLWQVAVTNTGNITASLLLTDVLDTTAPVNLAAACPSPPPVSLAPLGSPGSNYTCQLPGTVTEFTHTNTLTATVWTLDSVLTSVNAAGYIGGEGKVYIFLPVVLR